MAEAVQFHAERRAAPFCIDVKDIPRGPEAKAPDAYFAFMQIEPRRTEDRVPMRPVHGAAMRDSTTAFAHHFRGQAVEGYEDVPLRYLKRNRRGLVRPAHLYPDVLVRLGIPHSLARRRYDLNKLGPPDFVLEVLSLSTWRYDLGHKLNLYALLGVRECFFFEPTGELPAGGELQGFALSRSGKRRLPLEALPTASWVCAAGCWAFAPMWRMNGSRRRGRTRAGRCRFAGMTRRVERTFLPTRSGWGLAPPPKLAPKRPKPAPRWPKPKLKQRCAVQRSSRRQFAASKPVRANSLKDVCQKSPGFNAPTDGRSTILKFPI